MTDTATKDPEASPGTEVATKEPAGVLGLIELYKPMFAEALPQHVVSEQWVRRSIAALKRSPDLHRAAENNPPAALRVLMDCARLGHEPGSKEYYLIPRGNQELGREPHPKKPRETRLKQEITGLEGYQGIIERMYRAGAITSVKVEIVYSGDTFHYNPGLHDRPQHEVNWFEDRGEPMGAYAYAEMVTGGTSKIVIMSRDQIYEHRERSDSFKYNSGPWVTDEMSMWLKTVARQLEKWVPTSSEFLKERIRAKAEVEAEVERTRTAGEQTPEVLPDDPHQVIEGELVDDEHTDG
ncbi:RecT-like DNA pairing protein [Gordonia phage Cafasso]|uniref:RecT-like DNA pairing protein n=1 Tax=Gordonia phage Cafasso TaxID=2851095 RepID=A0AAE7VDZ8_9CAUD|nr:RecT-like DNA pairing protein [Gordonia phage Cafasso]